MIAAPEDDLVEFGKRLHDHQSHGAPVVENGRLVGIVTISDIARSDAAGKGRPCGPGDDSRGRRPSLATTRVSRALERMAALGVGRLPVVAEDDPDLLVGMFRREEAVRAYHEALDR